MYNNRLENQHDPVSSQKDSKKKKSVMNSKRFSDEQVKSLESIFTLGTKLETPKKLQVARDLGLQPRQVGIWFQNKRARWKSKQIEQDYSALKAKFDALNLKFDYLKKEKESLLIQLEELRYELENTASGHKNGQDSKGNKMLGDPDNNKETNSEIKENPGRLNEGTEDNLVMNKQEEGSDFLNLVELGDSPLASQEKWCGMGLDDDFDHSCGASEWWF